MSYRVGMQSVNRLEGTAEHPSLPSRFMRWGKKGQGMSKWFFEATVGKSIAVKAAGSPCPRHNICKRTEP